MTNLPTIPAEFKRTVCACADCVRCCHVQPGVLAPGDLERIAAHLGKPVRDVLNKFWASPGGVLGNRDSGKMLRVGSITPRLREGRCVFLTDDDRCSIHQVAPFGCAYADTHMSKEEGQRIMLWMYQAAAKDERYQAWRKMLPAATSYRPNVNARML